jgi:quinol monooxygenase YgiN
MHFNKKDVDKFQLMFDSYKEQIRKQPGCTFLELYQDKNDPQRFFTYSYWENEESLNKYRKSALFQEVWPQTKILFDKQPQANTVVKIRSLL